MTRIRKFRLIIESENGNFKYSRLQEKKFFYRDVLFFSKISDLKSYLRAKFGKF